MKIIIDRKLKNRLESLKLSPYRSFTCAPCARITDRNGVKKDEHGIYRCLICGKPVKIGGGVINQLFVGMV
jgi:ribosomal protein L37AE/L43A